MHGGERACSIVVIRASVTPEVLGRDNPHSCASTHMPSDVGASTNGAFKYLKDRVWKRVQGWMEQSLSAGGKEVLIKAVAQAIPTYSMSCFKLPRGLCEHLNGIMRGFWWGSKEDKRKTCWVSWDTMIKPKKWGGLGFRDIELFNLALLARQAWRILNDPASLSARILRAVYYPGSEFLEASLGAAPSQVWRAILEGKEVLHQGIIRRIGTGESTNIWSMNWLPKDGHLRPLACPRPNPPQMVSELLDHTSASWDRGKLQYFFTPMDADIIGSIPLTTRRQEDFWAWHYEKTGIFSVRSAYRMLVQNRETNRAWLEGIPSRSDVRADEKEWTSLWKIKVPSKIRVFLWRLAKHSIPTGNILHRRNMAPKDVCQICGARDSWKHSLLECNMAKCVWALEKEETMEYVCNLHEQNAKAWLVAASSSLPQEETIRVMVTLWAIWHAKRKAIYENSFQSPLSTRCFVDRLIYDLSLSGTRQEVKERPVLSSPRWIPPPQGLMKINVDAALSKNKVFSSVAAVARNGAGDFLGASSVVIEGITDPETMEILACREGLALANDLSFRRVQMASDCSNAVRSLSGSTLGSYGHIIKEIREGAASFQEMVFVHERREANQDAHILARSSLYNSLGRHVWFFDPPDGVCNSYFVPN